MKGHFGGMHTPLFYVLHSMVPFSFALAKDTPTHFLKSTKNSQFCLVLFPLMCFFPYLTASVAAELQITEMF